MTHVSSPERWLDVVISSVEEVLGPGVPLSSDTNLLEISGFDSLKLAALIEVLEQRLETELPSELLVPEHFATPDTIVEGVVRATVQGGSA